MEGDRFCVGLDAWLDRLGALRNVVRQEIVRRQLRTAALPPIGARVLDVGAGQGTQAIALALDGYAVTIVEPDPRMRAACTAAVALQPADVADRVEMVDARLQDLDGLGGDWDLVLCHGVLMYLDSPDDALRRLAARVSPGGALSVVTRNDQAMAWRPALRHDWAGVLAVLDELAAARREGRDATYRNEIGVTARADSVDHLADLLATHGLPDSQWFGVRVATDGVAVDAPVPSPDALAALLDAEEALGRTDPYRRSATLFHLVARR